MRVVADTNIVVSGLMWRGNPRKILDAARTGEIQLLTTVALLAELEAFWAVRNLPFDLRRPQ
jgi:putative PIN family toxin of toxin-antitoxin system